MYILVYARFILQYECINIFNEYIFRLLQRMIEQIKSKVRNTINNIFNPNCATWVKK